MVQPWVRNCGAKLGPHRGRELDWKLGTEKKGESQLATQPLSCLLAQASRQWVRGRWRGRKDLFKVLLRDLVGGEVGKYL